MTEREELIEIIMNHPEICETLLELLRSMRGQTTLDLSTVKTIE